jgi:hypothetical protein
MDDYTKHAADLREMCEWGVLYGKISGIDAVLQEIVGVADSATWNRVQELRREAARNLETHEAAHK